MDKLFTPETRCNGSQKHWRWVLFYHEEDVMRNGAGVILKEVFVKMCSGDEESG